MNVMSSYLGFYFRRMNKEKIDLLNYIVNLAPEMDDMTDMMVVAKHYENNLEKD